MDTNKIYNRTIYYKIVQSMLLLIRRLEEHLEMKITATELKNNLGKYLEMANKEDVVITKNGKDIARLTAPESIEEKIAILDSLVGIAKGVEDYDYKADRLSRQ